MSRLLRYILLFALLPLLASCNDDWLLPDGDDLNGERPVEFSFVWPGMSQTRGFDEDVPVKTKFSGGDVIHILGTFKTKSLQEDGNYKYGEVVRYGALEFNGTTHNWTPVAGNTLTWPSVATEGEFKAYYTAGSNGVLTYDRPEFVDSLSGLTPTTDPLQADWTKSVTYGHAVELNFSHICAYLKMADLHPMVAEKYFLTTNAVGEVDDNDVKHSLNNYFKLVLSKTTDPTTGADVPSLDFSFFQQPSGAYKLDGDWMTYVAGSSVDKEINQDGVLTTVSSAGFFLEPGYYDKFTLRYPASGSETYEYLTYDYNNIPDNVGGVDVANTPPLLKANTTYTLTVTKSPGITIENPPSAEGWDDDGTFFDVDVNEFLKAACNGTEYKDETTGEIIIEKTPTGSKLRHNVNFNYYDYSQLEASFEPNIQTGLVFDGDYHYIKNLAHPLFRYNYGTIQNLGIQEIEIDAVSIDRQDVDDASAFMNRYGALCMWNRAAGLVNNARVKNVTMNIKVQSNLEAGQSGSETHNMGCVVGSNTGTVSGVELSGKFTLNALPDNGNTVNSSVLIGGITGQNAAEGTITDVAPYENNFSVSINNTCQGELGSYSIGGIAGASSGQIADITLSNVSVNSSGSVGVTSYIGGMVGQLEVSAGQTRTSSLESCVVGGSVRAGVSAKYNEITSASYIGGIAGVVLNTPVTDCRAMVSVYGTDTAAQDVVYATGGAFGRIRPGCQPSHFYGLIAYGSLLQKPQGTASATNFIGNFAGIIPVGQTWDDYSTRNILLHDFGTIGNVGTTLD